METPVFDILSLTLSHTITTVQSINDDSFQVRTGLRNVAATAFGPEQVVSAAAGALTVSVSSSDTAVAQAKNSGGSGASVQTSVAVNSSRTPVTVVSGGVSVQYSPTSTGTTTIAATAPGYLAGFDSADDDVSVTVNPASMTLTDTTGVERVGGGLQSRYRVTLSGGEHGGVIVRVAGGDPDTLLISPNATTGGTAFIDLVCNNLETQKDFFVQGVLAETGTVTVTGSAPGFLDGTVDVEVETPIFDIFSLATSTTASAPDDPFQIRTGIANVAFTTFATEQDISAAIAPLSVTVSSSVPATAQLVTTASTGGSVSVDIVADAARTGISVAAGGVALDPLAAGSTDISASAAGFGSLPVSDTESVTVNP